MSSVLLGMMGIAVLLALAQAVVPIRWVPKVEACILVCAVLFFVVAMSLYVFTPSETYP